MVMKFGWFGAAVLAWATTSVSWAAVLYDGSMGTSPAAQGYFSYGSAHPTGTYFTQNPGSIELNSTSIITIQSGFQNYTPSLTGLENPAFPTLDSSTGYTVSVNMQTVSENHAVDDRAGFNLIAISANETGIALGFWPGSIFAQNADFSAGESASFDTTAAITQYDLSVTGSSYALSTGSTTLLSGPLRSYSDSSDPSFIVLPNFVFFGDDTGGAGGDTIVSRLAVTVPEPASASLLLLGGVFGLARGRSRQNARSA